MSKKKVIVFDLDGVLFDSIALAAAYMKRKYPEITEKYFKEFYKENLHQALKNITLKKVEVPATAKEDFTAEKAKVPMYPGVKELLADLARENYLAINTSAWARNTLPLLEGNDVLKHFSFVVTAETDKSKVEKFKMIAENFKTVPSQMIFVTDTIGDVKEAQEAGVPSVVVTWGIHTQEDFEGNFPSNLIGFADTAPELKQFIDNFESGE